MICKFLFPFKKDNNKCISVLLLCFRIVIGLLLIMHGWQKIANYETLSTVFPDPLHIGSKLSVTLAIFAEFFCSFSLILGLLYRLGVIPIIFTMIIAFFVTHHGSISQGELAFSYLVSLVFLYCCGPGLYSLDYLIYKKGNEKCPICK